LLTTSCAVCFENALVRVARERKASLEESSMTAHVSIRREADGDIQLLVE
jgi:organic hydroperoxide reductase OsmC/OhrA